MPTKKLAGSLKITINAPNYIKSGSKEHNHLMNMIAEIQDTAEKWASDLEWECKHEYMTWLQPANTRTLVYHQDPAHGWIAASKQELMQLNIHRDISTFSYTDGMTVYLEEDSDAPKYINALKKKGIEVQFEYMHEDNRSFIRDLPRLGAS